MNRLRFALKCWILAVFAVGAGQFSHRANAAYYPITTQAGLNANANISIAALGSNGTIMTNPFTTSTSLGDPVTFTQFASASQRVNQGAGWNGNFAPNEPLLWTRFGGPVTMNFSGPALKTFGLQIQPDIYGRFTAYVSVLNNVGGVLATFNFTGTSTNLGNDSALFIGVGSDSATTDFASVRIGILTGGNIRNFAFNSPEFQVVPEPSTYALAAVGVVTLAGIGRRRKRKA
ncbi:PEP-CTERM sorting domain-containing protein [bacterium]|nr:PEP-CTERM sorting domain-containing protein [bacterium]